MPVEVRSGRPSRQPVEVDAALELAGLGERGDGGAVERVLACALVAQPRLGERELALDDLADLHAGESERPADRARDDAEDGAVLARLGEARERLPQPAAAGGLAGLGRLAAERVGEHGRGAPQRGVLRLRARCRHEQRGRLRHSERLDAGARLDARAPLDDPVMTPLRAEREAALPLDPDRDRHREAAMQERAGDVTQLGRRQVTRERRSERIIKALGRRAGGMHTTQSNRHALYTLARG